MGGQSGYLKKPSAANAAGVRRVYRGPQRPHRHDHRRRAQLEHLPSAFAFETFFNHEVQVTISAEDDSYSQPAIPRTRRWRSPIISTEAAAAVGKDAQAGRLQRLYRPISLFEEGTVTVYARLTDHAGNVTYLGSDGILFETDAPQLSGAQDGGTYCGTVTLTASDPHLDTVTVNGAPVTVTEGSFEVAPAEGAQTIRATDKAGMRRSGPSPSTTAHLHGLPFQRG